MPNSKLVAGIAQPGPIFLMMMLLGISNSYTIIVSMSTLLRSLHYRQSFQMDAYNVRHVEDAENAVVVVA